MFASRPRERKGAKPYGEGLIDFPPLFPRRLTLPQQKKETFAETKQREALPELPDEVTERERNRDREEVVAIRAVEDQRMKEEFPAALAGVGKEGPFLYTPIILT